MPSPRTAPPPAAARSPLPRRIAAALLALAALAAAALTGTAAARAYTPSPLERSAAESAEAAVPHLRYLGAALRDGAGADMQVLFPEGFVFSHALYGLAWMNTAELEPKHAEQARDRARWALEQMESPQGRAPFPEGAAPESGVFHAGWSTYLLARVAEADGTPAEERRLAGRAAEIADAFAASLDAGRGPFLEAYPGRAWPVDSVVAAAALARADRALGTDTHAELLAEWLAAADERTDPQTGLLPHSADPAGGAPLEGARGSSQALLLRFLPDIDPDRSAADYARFRTAFDSTHFWAPGIREFPHGDSSPGDVDSGPLIAGLSASASAVALGAAATHGDTAAAAALTGLGEPLGLATGSAERRYLFGALPVGDAFFVWSHTAVGERPPLEPAGGLPAGPPSWWRLPWQLGAAAAVALPAAAAWMLGRPRRGPAQARIPAGHGKSSGAKSVG